MVLEANWETIRLLLIIIIKMKMGGCGSCGRIIKLTSELYITQIN